MTQENIKEHGLGFWGLTGIVFGSVIGGSIFNLAQTLARSAALGPVLLAWLITGLGVLFLVFTLKRLSDARPDLKAGIYQYAQQGFGNYMGFNMAWGYWLCVILGNVTYGVMISDTLGAFLPAFRGGWMIFGFGTLLVWVMYGIVSRGIQSAASVNTALSVVKFLCILLILGVLGLSVKIGMWSVDFWGHLSEGLGSVEHQFSGCMLVTVWSFLGIEGAVMMSARARKPKDVGKATVTGYLLGLILYILVSLLCFGVMTQPQLAALPNPSLAYVLDATAGPWAKWLVIGSVLISLTGGFISWTLVCAQVPYEAARVKIFPRRFLKLNNHGMPAFGMAAASVVMTLCLLLVVTAEDVYVAALNLASLMVLPPYLFCGLYLWKIAGQKGRWPLLKGNVWLNRGVAALEIIYCLYVMWAATLQLLMVVSVFYLVGAGIYLIARRENTARPIRLMPGIFTRWEFMLFMGITILAALSVLLLMTGNIQLDV